MMSAVTLLTYPARPLNGGPLETAPPKAGRWCYEPKYNGWRALVHVPTGTMFNRHGARLSISPEFTGALALLRRSPFEWLDCEALERRHSIGRGTLVVLDYVAPPTPYLARRELLSGQDWPVALGSRESFPDHAVTLSASVEASQAFPLWHRLQEDNRVSFGCDFYEGLVGKRADSLYPVQLVSPEQTMPHWIKHRFL
jgi:hypothetical protein